MKMMKMLDTTHNLFAPAKAEKIAAEMAAGDEDGWTYKVVHAPTETGYSFIEVYDEDDKFVERV